MKQSVYVIYDAKAKLYNFPFQFLNDNVALRSCSEIVSDPNSKIAMHPADFYMFKIADYDDETGKFDILETKQEIAHFLHVEPLKQPTPTIENARAGLRGENGTLSVDGTHNPAKQKEA